MATITASDAGGANRVAFLDMIAVSELGQPVLDQSDDGYNVLVGSYPGHVVLFPSYDDQPNILVAQFNSTAAGRYQILHTYWAHYKALLNLPDFGPLSQDKYALQQIKERSALPLIDAGQFAAAVARCNNIWASLTGSQYGQRTNSLAYLQEAYESAGGTVTA